MNRICFLVALSCGLFTAFASETFAQGGGGRSSGGGISSFDTSSGFGGGGQSGFGGNNSSFGQSNGGFQTNNQNGNQGGFVGGDASAIQQLFSGMTGQQGNRRNINIQSGNRNNNRSSRSNKPLVRLTLQIAFAHPKISTSHVKTEVAKNLSRTLKKNVYASQIIVEGRKVTLRGTVADEHSKRIAEQMALLEPGVSTVENLLVVQTKN